MHSSLICRISFKNLLVLMFFKKTKRVIELIKEKKDGVLRNLFHKIH